MLQHYYRPQRSCEGYVFTPVCHSVHGGSTWAGTPPRRYTLTPTPRDQVHPPGRYTPGQVNPTRAATPPGRYTPPPRPRTWYTPWNQVHPQVGTPPQDQVHPPGRYTLPPRPRTWYTRPPGDSYCCGRYTSY